MRGMNPLAERYTKLVLSLGEHDPDSVDAYYGPPQWRDEVRATKPSLDFVHAAALALHEDLSRLQPDPRSKYLRRQTEALIARAEIVKDGR